MASRLRILIAEDNRVLADVMRFNLEAEGFEVTVAHNGQKALGIAQTDYFDLVISDYQMPGLSGEELLRGIRADSVNTTAVCVLCSAKGYELDEEQLTDELGLHSIVMKPFSPRDLVVLAQEIEINPGPAGLCATKLALS
jgi:DNA-binding response OmpR family regulator